jgi:hypothetical protein
MALDWPRRTMNRNAARVLALSLATSAVALAGCEQHKASAARGAPEYLHEALSGDVGAQSYLAGCLAERSDCVGLPPDPPLACAWRGVRLASWSPDLSLSDVSAFATACANADETFRQRASIALSDLAARIYRRGVGGVAEMVSAAEAQHVLYPAIDTVRTRMNEDLGAIGRPERLPPFGRPTLDQQGRLEWSACDSGVCLEGVTPAFGGGVLAYRVVVRPTAVRAPASLAASLGAAGLEAPSAADLIRTRPDQSFENGPVCWRSGEDAARGGVAYAGASLGPCTAAKPL